MYKVFYISETKYILCIDHQLAGDNSGYEAAFHLVLRLVYDIQFHHEREYEFYREAGEYYTLSHLENDRDVTHHKNDCDVTWRAKSYTLPGEFFVR